MNDLLNGSVQLVMLQFSFSNDKIIPAGLFKKKEETVGELASRKSSMGGKQFIDSDTDDISVSKFISDLFDAGYFLADGFSQKRSNAQGRYYQIVQFAFAKDTKGKSPEFLEHASKALLQLCSSATWKVRAYLNPFYKNKQSVNGSHVVSINLLSRNPIVDADGNRICQWRRNEDGEKIGAGPIPIEPKLFLRIKNDDIKIV